MGTTMRYAASLRFVAHRVLSVFPLRYLFSQVLKYVELVLLYSFPFHSLRVKYEPSQGAMMIDLSTMRSLELIENLQNAKSRDCLYGLLNQTLTPMGARLLKSTVLQPSTDKDILEKRWDALAELTAKEDVFFAVRQGNFRNTLHLLLPITLDHVQWCRSSRTSHQTHVLSGGHHSLPHADYSASPQSFCRRGPSPDSGIGLRSLGCRNANAARSQSSLRNRQFNIQSKPSTT